MIMNDNFILKELPENLKGFDLVQMLNEIYMDPMEREMIKAKLKYQESKGEVLHRLSYNGGLVREFIKFHEKDLTPFNIGILGLSSVMVNVLTEAFEMQLANEFVCRIGQGDKVYRNSKTLTFLHRAIVAAAKDKRKDPFQRDDIERLRGKHQQANLTLEYVGHELKEKVYHVCCVIYDRHYNKHGFVIFRI